MLLPLWFVGVGRCLSQTGAPATCGPVNFLCKESTLDPPTHRAAHKGVWAVGKHRLGDAAQPRTPPSVGECDRPECRASRPNRSQPPSQGPVSRPLVGRPQADATPAASAYLRTAKKSPYAKKNIALSWDFLFGDASGGEATGARRTRSTAPDSPPLNLFGPTFPLFDPTTRVLFFGFV